MKKLYLIALTAFMAATFPVLAEEKPGMVEEQSEQHGPAMMEEQGAQMMGKPGPEAMGKQGPHRMFRETMWKQMQARNAELEKLVETMNSAQGSEKVDATAAVVNKLVEIHMDMSNRMMQMHKKGMWHGCYRKGMRGGKMMEGKEMGSEMMEKKTDTTHEEEHEQ